MYNNILKRLLDFLISALSLVFLGWFIIIIAICLLFANKGTGVFFLQERPGKDNKLFKIIKFKTMTDEKDSEGNLLPDDKRLTVAEVKLLRVDRYAVSVSLYASVEHIVISAVIADRPP